MHGDAAYEAALVGIFGEEVIDVLHTLTSFESFDNLAGATHTPEDVIPLLCRLTLAILELEGGRAAGGVPDIRSKRRSKRCT